MKVIIAGGRDFCNKVMLIEALKHFTMEYGDITEVVCGMADGADTLGMLWANFMDIPVKKFPADWGKYGNSAGPIRNKEMANYADALIAFWNRKSKGTLDMINKGRDKKIIVVIVEY